MSACPHGEPRGETRCALCRHAIDDLWAADARTARTAPNGERLLPRGERPMPPNFRELVAAAAAGDVITDTTGPIADRPMPADRPFDFAPALDEGEDYRTRQLPTGDR